MASQIVASMCIANQNLTKELYQILSKKDGNILCSSLCVHASLSLLLQNASGETAFQLQNALHLADIEMLAKGYQEVIYALNLEENVQLYLANKMFLNKECHLQEEFVSVVERYFWTEIENVSFFPETAEVTKKINEWVKNKTNNKIDSVIDGNVLQLEKSAQLVLVNVIYFNGQWRYPFCKKATQKEKFYVSETETVECDMLNIQKMYQYSEDLSLDVQILLLPYRNNNLKMLLIVPKSKTGMKNLEEKLETINLRDLNIFSSLKKVVQLSIPKFKLEATINMKETLRIQANMGLDILFTECCELSDISMSREKINVSSVIQKLYIEIGEEEETVASYARTIYKRTARLHRRKHAKPPPVVVNADHPFFFFVYYNYDDQFLPIISGKLERP